MAFLVQGGIVSSNGGAVYPAQKGNRHLPEWPTLIAPDMTGFTLSTAGATPRVILPSPLVVHNRFSSHYDVTRFLLRTTVENSA